MRASLYRPARRRPRKVDALLERIGATVAEVEAIAGTRGGVARLALPSRQAYEWFKFLSVRVNLQLHLSTLESALIFLKEIEGQDRYARYAWRPSLEFYHTASEWRVRQKGLEIRASLSEGFVGAGAEVIQALVRLVFQARRKSYRQIVRAYATGHEFAETLQAIELPTAELDPHVRGRHHDLGEVFDRVNRAYFDGRLTPPHLRWNKSRTIRLMGHYQYATDTVTISTSLDSAQVPDWAIDHVMHHELLHRVLGAQVVNGRLYAHTPAFRTAERAFREYAQADAFLNQWSASLRRKHGRAALQRR